MHKVDWENNTKICSLAWNHLYVEITGLVAPCCQYRDPYDGTNGGLLNAKQTSIKEAINSEGMKKMRLAMLANQDYSLCSWCDRAEALEIKSTRMYKNEEYLEDTKHLVEKTAPDGSIDTDEFNPLFTDLRFNNLCNLKCRTCSLYASSSWYDEQKLLTETNVLTGEPTGNKFQVPVKFNNNKLAQETLQYLDSVKHLYWAGGEPLILPEHYMILNHLIDSGRAKDIQLSYNTNATTTHYKRKPLIEYWKHFKSVGAFCSLDGIEDVAEYTRTNGKWETFKNTIDTYKKWEFEGLGVSTAQPCITISILNIHHLPDYVKYSINNNWMPDDMVMFAINIVDSPDTFSIGLLPSKEKILISQKLSELYQWLENECGNFELPKHIYNTVELRMSEKVTQEAETLKIQRASLPPDEYNILKKMKQRLDTYDISANLNWKKSLPLLADMFHRYNLLDN